MKQLKHRYCIVGVGNTAYGRNPGISQVAHNVLAIRAALHDAGLEASDLDGVLTKAPTSSFPMLFAPRVAESLGIEPKVTCTLDQAGASNIGLIQYAISAIELEQAEILAISYGDNPRTSTTAAYGRAAGSGSEQAFAGLFGAPPCYAMFANRYMHEYGTTPEDLAGVAITHRHHASLNPGAQFREPITVDDYRASPIVAEPFRKLDCCPVSDGGAAYIVTSYDRARHLRRQPVFIDGIGQSHPSWEFHRRPDLTRTGAIDAGRMALASAGITREEVDFCQIYDCFSIVSIVTLEQYGFAAPGRGGAFYREGRAQLGGELPCNTSGGLLSESGIPGTQLCVEAVRQLRHECGARQVQGAEVGLVSQQGGVLTTHATMILSNRG